MAKKTAKIVLMKEDVDVFGFANDSVKSAELIDSVSVMATDFLPEENTVQASQDMGFFVANLSDTEAKKLAQDPNVEAVEDDIRVYAMGGGIGIETPDDIRLRGSDLSLTMTISRHWRPTRTRSSNRTKCQSAGKTSSWPRS